MAKEKRLLKDSFYLDRIRRELNNESNAYKIVFEINLLIKQWENA